MMAVCASLYLLFLLVVQIPAVNQMMYMTIPIGHMVQAILLSGMIVMGLSVYFYSNELPVLSKALRWQAVAIALICSGMLLYNCIPVFSIQINGSRYFYWQSTWMHLLMLSLVVAWLWQYAFAKNQLTKPNYALRYLSVFMACGAALVLVFMIVSGIHVLRTGHVAGFGTNTMMSWIRPLVVLLFLGGYVWSDRKGKKCPERVKPIAHESKTQASYSKANRMLAWTSFIVVVIAGVVAILAVGFDWFHGSRFEDVYLITVVALVHMLWIGSVIAMMMDKHAKKWLRRLSVSAPLVINGVVMLFLWLEIYLPRRVIMEMDKIYTEDIPMVVLICSVALVILAWLINTFVVLRASVRQSRIE